MAKSQQLSNLCCPICERETPEEYLEKHHIIPKSKGGKETIIVCVDCGDMIHKLIPLNDLKKTYNTVPALKSHPSIIKWVKWVNNHSQFSICMSRKKRKK